MIRRPRDLIGGPIIEAEVQSHPLKVLAMSQASESRLVTLQKPDSVAGSPFNTSIGAADLDVEAGNSAEYA
jgi:hypothetical protein